MPYVGKGPGGRGLQAGNGWRGAAGNARAFVGGIVVAALAGMSFTAAFAADIRVLTSADGLPSNWVSALAAAPDGKLWVGTGNAGVALLDPAGKVTNVYTARKDGLPSDEVTAIGLFRGKVYVGTAGGLAVFDGSAWEAVTQVLNVTMRNVRLAASPDGKEMWVSSVYLAGGLLRYDGKEWTFMGGEGRGLFNGVAAIAFSPEGVLLGTVSGGAYLHTGTDILPLKEGLPPVSVFSAAAIGNRMFLGTSDGLLARDGARWSDVPLPAGFALQPVFSLAASGSDLLVAGGGGIARISSNKTTVLTVASGLPPGKIKALSAGEGYVAAGTPSGLAIIRKW